MLDTTPTNRIDSAVTQRQSAFWRPILALLSLCFCALTNQGVQAQQPEASAACATPEAAAKANAALIKNAYDAFSRGDIPGAMAAFGEDIF